MSIKRLVSSFKAAFHGLAHVLRTEQNFRIHTIVAVGVIGLIFFLPLEAVERAILVMLMGAVLTVELINTAVEYIMDLLKPRMHHYVAWVKDVMAAATLVTVMVAVIGGIIIVFPHFMTFVK